MKQHKQEQAERVPTYISRYAEAEAEKAALRKAAYEAYRARIARAERNLAIRIAVLSVVATAGAMYLLYGGIS